MEFRGDGRWGREWPDLARILAGGGGGGKGRREEGL
jgi:hypothetical protein